jgi:hypothetical protein
VLERPSQEGRLETPSDVVRYRCKNLLYTTLLAYPEPVSGPLERAQIIFTRPRPNPELADEHLLRRNILEVDMFWQVFADICHDGKRNTFKAFCGRPGMRGLIELYHG